MDLTQALPVCDPYPEGQGGGLSCLLLWNNTIPKLRG